MTKKELELIKTMVKKEWDELLFTEEMYGNLDDEHVVKQRILWHGMHQMAEALGIKCY